MDAKRWSKKKKILSQMQALAAKRKKAGPSSGEGTPSGNSTETETTAPTPDSGLSAPDNPDQSTLSFSDDDFWDCLDEWVRALACDDLKMLSLLLFELVRRGTSATVKNAAAAVSKVVHRDEKTIRVWRRDFWDNCGEFSEDARGRYDRTTIFYEEECRKKATAWARDHCCVKGQPNMTAVDFCHYTNADLLPNSCHPPGFPLRISVKTACRFLCDLGFQRMDSSKKGVYIDGHEREDVVEERVRYLDSLHAIESDHLSPPMPSDVLESDQIGNPSATKKLVTIFHDESTFQSSEDQRFMWSQPDQSTIKPKSRGSGRMVSDFIEEHAGYLRLTLGNN